MEEPKESNNSLFKGCLLLRLPLIILKRHIRFPTVLPGTPVRNRTNTRGLEPAVLTVILRGWHSLFVLTEDLLVQSQTRRPLRQRSKEGSVVETKIIITNYLYN